MRTARLASFMGKSIVALLNRRWWSLGRREFEDNSLPVVIGRVKQSEYFQESSGKSGWASQDEVAVGHGGIYPTKDTARIDDLAVGDFAVRKLGAIKSDSGFVEFDTRKITHLRAPLSASWNGNSRLRVVVQ